MYKISVVIPTYNRDFNLKLTLEALVCQSIKPLEIIIVDDGSTDKTNNIVREYADKLNIKYYWHKNKGYRLSLNRNQGARLINKLTTHILFIDSDVVLHPRAIEAYHNIISKHPDVVICGRYDWLPKMVVTKKDIKEFVKLSESKLKIIETDYNTGIIGKDPRSCEWESEKVLDSYGVLSGNLLIPREAFDKTGGFDEKIEDRGQDGEFGRNLISKGYKGIYSQRVIGYHLNHYRDSIWETKSVIKTIKYIHKKYNILLRGEHLPKYEKTT